jgi:hypothetical protein
MLEKTKRTMKKELSFSSPSTAYDKEKIEDTKGEF